MKKKLQALVLCAAAGLLLWTTTAEAIGMGGRFNRGVRRRATKTTTYIIPRVIEVWFGKLHTPAYNSGVCNDDDYIETDLLYNRRTDGASTFTYRGTGCSSDPASPILNHWSLTAGTYRITLSTHQKSPSSASCTIYIYGSTGNNDVDEQVISAKVTGNGDQGGTVFVEVGAGETLNLVPWTNTCTAPDANVQSFIMFERLLV